MWHQDQIAEYLRKTTNIPWSGISAAVATAFVTAAIISATLQSFFFNESRPQLTAHPPLSPAPRPEDPRALTPSLNPIDVRQILERNVFALQSAASEAALEPAPTAEQARVPESKLDLELLGVISSGTPETGAATLRQRSKPLAATFLVGEWVLPGVELIAVFDDRVHILNNGQEEAIKLAPLPDLSAGQRRARRKAASTAPKNIAAQDGRYAEPGFERAGSQILISGDYKQRLLTSDFSKVLQDAKAEPNLVGGELDGFRLTRIRSDSIYEKSGLQNGDIVREINGVLLTDTAQTIKLLNGLRAVSDIEILVLRGSAEIRLKIQVQ